MGKKQIESFITIIRLISRQSIGSPTRNHKFVSSILSWILNRVKEVVGWLPQNLWTLITGVGVLIYTYFMMKTRRK